MNSTLIEAALSHIPADDRETWMKMAFAVRSALGDNGWAVWDAWSRRSDKYNAQAARAMWRSANPKPNGVTAGSLYHLARAHGWQGKPERVNGGPPPTPSPARRGEEITATGDDAARRAEIMLKEAKLGSHPYLATKGFPNHNGLIYSGLLLIPMRHAETNQLRSLQTITSDGRKKFLRGGKVSGCNYRIGRGVERWVVEGFASGLSLREGLQALHRLPVSQIVVAFSAGNISKVVRKGDRIVADNDASETGERVAKATGCRWVMPQQVGTDINDVHQSRGLDAVVDLLRKIL